MENRAEEGFFAKPQEKICRFAQYGVANSDLVHHFCIVCTDGQKIAKKLCKQISKETKTLKALLHDYNACGSTDSLTLSEALDPPTIEAKLTGSGAWHATVATGKKRQIIDAYLGLCRSNEELSLLKQEATNLLHSYEGVKKFIVEKLLDLSKHTSDPYSRGTAAMLNLVLKRHEVMLKQANILHNALNSSAVLPDFDDDDDDDDSVFSDSDD